MKHERRWTKAVLGMLIPVAVMAVLLGIFVLLDKTILPGQIFFGAAVLMLILPPPYVIPVFADEPKERVQIASALSALTLVTMILFGVLSVVFNA